MGAAAPQGLVEWTVFRVSFRCDVRVVCVCLYVWCVCVSVSVRVLLVCVVCVQAVCAVGSTSV